MTRLCITLWELPKNSKRILEYLEYEAHILPAGEVTIAKVTEELGLKRHQIKYAMTHLLKHSLVTKTPVVQGKMHTNQLSINADTVERSDIKEMILNV